ncbi:MAG TPA: hypothetical protein VHZ03_41325 [Trebonia sp.]|nr:hypothetical protein [Trebonia sp.]
MSAADEYPTGDADEYPTGDADDWEPCHHDCDEDCYDDGCRHQHCFACGGCQCPGYCDDYQTYNLRPAETGGDQRSAAKPMSWYQRASLYLGCQVDYFSWPSVNRRLTPAQWRRLQHKGRSPRSTSLYYQHAPNKGRATRRQRKPRHG